MASPKLYASSPLNPANPPAPLSLSSNATNHDDHWDITAARARRNPPTRTREFTRTFTRSTESIRLRDKTSKSSPRYAHVARLRRRHRDYVKNGMEYFAPGLEELARQHGGRGLLPPSACVFLPATPHSSPRRRHKSLPGSNIADAPILQRRNTFSFVSTRRSNEKQTSETTVRCA